MVTSRMKLNIRAMEVILKRKMIFHIQKFEVICLRTEWRTSNNTTAREFAYSYSLVHFVLDSIS